jgi:hypothetical protein
MVVSLDHMVPLGHVSPYQVIYCLDKNRTLPLPEILPIEMMNHSVLRFPQLVTRKHILCDE